MPSMLAPHGSERGYKAELATGQTCKRCQAAHRVYNSQFTKRGKASGLKYSRGQVIDNLASPPRPGVPQSTRKAPQGDAPRMPPASHRGDTADDTPGQGTQGREDGSADRTHPSLGDRLTDALGKLRMPASDDYVNTDESPDYLHEIEPDPDPDDTDYSSVKADEFVINAAGMAKIEENLGTYLSVVGMTVEMIDPYCGPILYENFNNMVSKWAKVIAHYPAAANLFLDGKSGVIFTWIAALQATWPILKAVYDHHLSKTVVTRNGQAFRAQSNGQAPQFDATTPPMQDFNYSAT